jgi:adenine-specific DNA-methyltransferase
MQKPTITRKAQLLMVQFPARPSRTVIRDMREAGFTWSQARRAWIGDYSEEAEQAALEITIETEIEDEIGFFETAVNSVILGDCVEVLPWLPAESVDFVLTDPPYLVGYRDRNGRSIRNDRDPAWLKPAFAQIGRVMKPDTLLLSFYGWQSIDLFMEAWRSAGLRPVGHMVAEKGYASSRNYFHHCHEQAYLLAKGKPPVPGAHALLEDVRPWQYTGNKHHPTQKPVPLLKDMVRSFCPQGGIVLDPFAGSGSTGLAALESGRRFIGIELDEKFQPGAASRVRNASKLFTGEAA